jgi:hypothetical protein
MSLRSDSLHRRMADRRPLLALALTALVANLPIVTAAPAARTESRPRADHAAASPRPPVLARATLPLEPNRGQAPADVEVIARPGGQLVTFSSTGARISALTVRFVGAARRSPGFEMALPGHTNYYSGADRRRWIEGVPHYARVSYHDVYPGIGLAWYGNAGHLEHDWRLDAGADPSRIAMQFDGVSHVSIDAGGDLRLSTSAGDVILRAPVAYQPSARGRREIAARYVLRHGMVGIEPGAYDRTRPLVIDPVLAFSTYFGGAAFEDSPEVAIDAEENVYLAVRSASTSLAGGSVSAPGGTSLVITKLDPQGTDVLYATVLSGSSPSFLDGVAVDNAGNAYIVGSTTAPDFPVTSGAFQTSPRRNIGNFLDPNSMDVIVFKLAGNGAIVYGTYIGGRGTDFASAIAVDGGGQACITGQTGTVAFGNYPLRNEFQGGSPVGFRDTFVTVLNATGSDLVYSTRLRSGTNDQGRAIAVDQAGRVYVAGDTNGNSLQVKGQFGTAPFQDENAGGIDAWVAKFDPTASGDASLVYATFLGGAGTDSARGIAVDAFNRAYVTGITGSSGFPLRAASGFSILDSSNIINEAFVTELNANATALVFSTFLGGSNTEDGTGIALDATRNIFVTGFTSSADFRRVQAVTPGFAGGAFDAFVTKIFAGGTAIAYSTTFGGSGDDRGRAIAVHVSGAAVIAGTTTSSNLPTQPSVLQEDPAANIAQGDAFVLRINP